MPPVALNREVLRRLSPLDGLQPESLDKLAADGGIQELAQGRFVFKQGDAERRAVYLLSGTVELRSGERVLASIEAGSEEARHPLAPQIPRHLSARAATDISCFSVDSDLLDIMLTWDQTGVFEVGEMPPASGAETGQDWMAAALQIKAFHRIPPANIQVLFQRMQALPVKQGQVIIKQGDPGDYFYIVAQGRCAVVREVANNSTGIPLAELSVGAGFGEEALLTDAARTATVSMLSDGILARLAKADFKDLLIAPQQQWVSLDQARQMVAAGGQWLDVRLPGEYARQHPEGAVNLPLYALRMKFDSLDQKRDYVLCCDTGRRSSAAAFILSERGFNAHILKGGLAAY